MSLRNDKTEKGKRIVIGKAAQDVLRQLVVAINDRLIGMRAALNVPEGWGLDRDQMGVPTAFIPQAKPVVPGGPTKVVKKVKKKAKNKG